MFEIKHLKTMAALAETNSVRKAAEKLFISQSALSHQIKALERIIGYDLFYRNSTPLQFSEQGQLLLNLAQQVLPQIESCQIELKQTKTKHKNLPIAMACHGCFQWLLPTIKKFNDAETTFTITLCDEIFDQHTHAEMGILFTDEKDDVLAKTEGFTYELLGNFDVVAVMSPQNIFAEKPFLSVIDFKQIDLLTYPVHKEKLDIFTQFLTPKNIIPKTLKQVANSHKMLQMVAVNMGVAVVPKWLISSLTMQSLLNIKKLGENGIQKSLYARYRTKSTLVKTIKKIVIEAEIAFKKLA